MIDIKSVIPHREPFLFVDEIREIGDSFISARKAFQKEEAFFMGHYPNDPIVPGVILCEAIFQTAAIFALNKFSKLKSSRPVLARVNQARFKSIVYPEELLTIHVIFKEKLGKFCFLEGKIEKSNNLIVVKADFTLVL